MSPESQHWAVSPHPSISSPPARIASSPLRAPISNITSCFANTLCQFPEDSTRTINFWSFSPSPLPVSISSKIPPIKSSLQSILTY